jgi:sulfide dehydrogenase [flavocytochrome c] flavoprotein chain
MRTTRRRFLKSAAASGAAVSLLAAPAIAQGVAGKVVVVGGGFGGATAAKYLKLANAKLDVTLIERDDRYITCPFSNYVLGGFRKIEENVQTFDALAKLGVKVTKGEAAGIDAPGRLLRLSSGSRITYDKLIV